MCMMCEEEAMYQAYLAYLTRKARQPGQSLTPEERSFLQSSGLAATGFACDPASADGSAESRGEPQVS
jgi:hypothetical protein